MKQGGFTLIELLVVVAIIVLLVAALVPCIQSSRYQAKALLCASNIRQMVLGLTLYESECQSFPYALNTTPLLPPPGGYPGNHTCDRMGWWWFNYIADYSFKENGKKLVFWCPSRKVANQRLETYVVHGNYGVNQSICKSSCGRKSHAEFIGTPLHSSDISHPSQTLLMIDSGYAMISWWHATDKPPIPLGATIEDTAYIPGLRINRERDLWPGQEEDAIDGRHPNKTINVGFVDGHISRVKADYLFVEKTDAGYNNRHPLWVPEWNHYP
jgi:prepilin-type N-terminal cleavage/methylation domain-containing protein/prepilin-type processing-associated H-X9-DG protein